MQIGVATVEICMKIQNEQTPTNKYIRYPTHTIPWCMPLPSYSRDSCWAMFTDALFTIGRKWAHRKVHQLIDNKVYLHMVEFYSVIKKWDMKPERN